VSPTPALLVTGMHRSGTSLLASRLVEAGVDLGADLLAADDQNRRGYFEDRPFVDLQRRMVAVACGDGGWPDWGWSESEALDERRFAAFETEARELLSGRSGDRSWGWKDPRTSLLLDFWDGLAPDARYLFVYRPPWEVADSILRYAHPAIGSHPSFALRVWAFYNERILQFARRHPERVALVSVDAVVHSWPDVIALVDHRLGVPLTHAEATAFDPELLERNAGALEAVVRDRAPWCLRILDELERAADLPLQPEPGADVSVDATDPVVSIVVTACEGDAELLEAVASCDRIRDVHYEVVVVDDGSTSAATGQILRDLGRLGYRVLSQENKGLPAARNAGLLVARGRYVLPLDQDNRLRPEYVTRALAVMERDPAVGVVYGDAQRFGARHDRWEMGTFDLQRMLRWNHIDACAVIRMAALDECGGYDVYFRRGPEDWDLWLSLTERGWRFHYVPEILFDYRVGADSMVSGLNRPAARGEVVAHLVAKHRDLYAEHLPEVVGGLQEWIGELYTSATSLETEVDKLTQRVATAERDAADLRSAATSAEAELARIDATRTWRLRNRLVSLLRGARRDAPD
jgi:GT2 family glycosyltransferase